VIIFAVVLFHVFVFSNFLQDGHHSYRSEIVLHGIFFFNYNQVVEGCMFMEMIIKLLDNYVSICAGFSIQANITCT